MLEEPLWGTIFNFEEITLMCSLFRVCSQLVQTWAEFVQNGTECVKKVNVCFLSYVSYNFYVERKLLHNFYFLVSCPCLLGIAHMHFIANSYKRFSKTTSTSPRQQVPLRFSHVYTYKYKKCIQMFNFQKNSFKSVHQCNKKLWPFKVFIFSAHSTGTIDALFEFYLFICIYTTEAMY